MERRQVKGFPCFNIEEKRGPLVSYQLFFQLPCFTSITKYKHVCNASPMNTVTRKCCTWYPELQHIIALATALLLALFICLSLNNQHSLSTKINVLSILPINISLHFPSLRNVCHLERWGCLCSKTNEQKP